MKKLFFIASAISVLFTSCNEQEVKVIGDANQTEGVSVNEDGSKFSKYWVTNYDQALEVAAHSNKGILLLFTGSDWCPPCKKANKTIFADDLFYKNAGKDYVLLKLDNKKSNAESRRSYIGRYQKMFNVSGVPSVLFLDTNGKELLRENPLSSSFQSKFK